MNWSAYPAYTDSAIPELGDIPQEWRPVRLRHHIKLNPPVPAKVREVGDATVPFLPMEAIGEDWSLDLSRSRPVDELLTGYTYFEEGDVLFAKVTPCFENGKGALINEIPTAHGFGTSEVTTIRPTGGLEQRFIGYLVQSDRFKQAGVGAMTGAGGLKRVPDDFVRNFWIGMPSTFEQRIIVHFLDCEAARIDALIDKQEQLIATLREDRASTITHTVTKGLNPDTELKYSGTKWLGDVPRHWSVQKLGRTLNVKTGFAFQSEDFTDSGIPVLRIGDISPNGRVDLSMAKHLPLEFRHSHDGFVVNDGDIVIAMTGATVGKPGRLNSGTQALLNQRVCSLDANGTQLSNQFLWFIITSSPYQKYVALTAFGGAQPNISDAELTEFTIAVPPTEEQALLVAYLDKRCTKIDSLITKANEVVTVLREYRSALITAAVTGSINVQGAA